MSFSIKSEELDNIRNIVDKIEVVEGGSIVFVEFRGIKDIPIHIKDEYSIKEDKIKLGI